MGLLTPKGKKGDKKNNNAPKHAAQQSKFITGKSTKSAGQSKKGMMTGGAQRGS